MDRSRGRQISPLECNMESKLCSQARQLEGIMGNVRCRQVARR